MKTVLRLILWPVLLALLLPAAFGSAVAGALMWVFDPRFNDEDGWGFFLLPAKFLLDSFPLKGSK